MKCQEICFKTMSSLYLNNCKSRTDLPLFMIKTEQLKKALRVVFKTKYAKIQREEDLTLKRRWATPLPKVVA